MTSTPFKYMLYASVAALALTSGQALGQTSGALEEIIITATKMGETSLQKTPLAVTAFTAGDLEKTGIKDIRDLATSTPNLVVTQNGPFAQVYIRGIGSNNVFAGSDPSSTLHVDGVYIARPAGVFSNFLDIERIEVLRGPQGTLYGRNSVGGTVNVISRKPDNEFRAKAQGTVGNYNLWRGEGYISGPIVEDKLSASVSAMGSKHDGYFKNIVASGNDRGSESAWATRGQVRATPNEQFELVLRADYMKDKGDPVGNQALLMPFDAVTNSILGDWHKVALDTPSRTDRRLWGVSGEMSYSFSEAAVLKSLTAYRDSLLDYTADTDGTDQHRQVTNQFESQHQFSEELNLSGKLDRLGYVFGVYYFDERITTESTVVAYNLDRVTHPAPKVHTKAWAAYGQANYELTDQITATAGLRYTDEKKRFDQFFDVFTLSTGVSLPGNPLIYLRNGHYKAWTPKFGLEYRPLEDVMLYGSVTRGFKSGGFNFTGGSLSQGFRPETLWSYEVGFKSEFLDRRVRFNGSAFYYDYKDLQVQAFIIPGVADITNAANASVKGIELELAAKPFQGLDIGGSLNYLRAVYKDYPVAPVPGGGIIDATGHYLNSAPKWSYTMYAQYNTPLGDMGTGFVRAEFGWKDRQFFTVANDAVQTMAGYGLVNASIGYSSPDDRWQLIAYGRNLANKQYLITTGTFTAVPAGAPGDPRTFGVRATYSY